MSLECCACLSWIEHGEAHSLIGCAEGHTIHKSCLVSWQRTDCARELRQRARSTGGPDRQAFPCPSCFVADKGLGVPAVDDDGGGGGGGDYDDHDDDDDGDDGDMVK